MLPMAPSSTRMRSLASRRSICSREEMSLADWDTELAPSSGVLPLPLGERVGVRGTSLVDCTQDLFQYTVDIANNIVVPKSQNEITHGLQHGSSARITRSALIMLPAVDLENDF